MIDLILIGFGTVGQGFTEILRDRGAALSAQYGFDARIVGVATRSRGTLSAPSGLNPAALLDAIASGSLDTYPDQADLTRDGTALDLIARIPAHAMLETSWSDFETARPALDHCMAAFDHGMHVILANKGPVALAYEQLQQAADKAGRMLRFEGTVMAGTPTVTLGLEALAGAGVSELRGILNGTTNYMLDRMAAGLSYQEALAEAQSLGYAEADPTADVDGWDAAGKVLILAAALFGKSLSMSNLSVEGIRGITPADIARAAEAGERYRLIARADTSGGSVGPVRLSLSDPLAQVGGATNAVTYITDLMGPITLVGAGAGRAQTGFALLADLLAIQRAGGF